MKISTTPDPVVQKTIEYLDCLTPRWLVLDVMRAGNSSRGRSWVALMVDVDPNDLKTCVCEFPTLLYVHPDEHRPSTRIAHQRWFRIPGKYRNRDAAYDALEEMMQTRH